MHIDERIVEYTEREAVLLSQLHHPSIIVVVGTTLSPEGPALLLEPTYCSVALFVADDDTSSPKNDVFLPHKI